MIAIVVIAVILVVSLAGIAVRAASMKKRQAVSAGYDTPAFRASIDSDRIRGVRESKGEVSAIKALRDDFPGMPLQDAVRLVRQI
jgi:hypothetical protein